MKSELNPKFYLCVKNTPSGDETEEIIRRKYQDMKDFEPKQMARQILQLNSILAMRTLFRDLKSNLLDNVTYRMSWVNSA